MQSTKPVLAKICGVRSVEAAQVAMDHPGNVAFAIGMIFAPTRRQVSTDVARQIVQLVRDTRQHSGPVRWSDGAQSESGIIPLPTNKSATAASIVASLDAVAKINQDGTSRRVPVTVGVFQNQPIEHIREMVATTGIDFVQLHGNENVKEYSDALHPIPIIKAVHIGPDGINGEQANEIRQLARDVVILLDAYVPSAGAQQGGHGKAFNWENTAPVMNQIGIPYVLAGGLSCDNVADAIRVTQPWVVDVSSGIETDGVKDPAKIKRFLDIVAASY
ncbi:hypothetical protein GQ42DRAFT_164780 [Ramicandelaber brevisporus]|nr:hypothetical protein GQ42DRAFT_164780 [Ramicandelaber brevisporus]